MTLNRIIILILMVLAFFVSYAMDIPNGQFNFCLATGLLLYEMYNFRRFRLITYSSRTFKLKSYEWVGGIGLTAFLIFNLSDDQMDLWNILAIVEVLIFGGFYTYRNRTLIYVIEDIGIRNMSNGNILDKTTITKIKFNKEQLAIDTTKFKNDLVIKSAMLKSPGWNELKIEISKLSRGLG